MRIMFGEDTVIEIFDINVVRCWLEGHSTEDVPDNYIVLASYSSDHNDYIGQYKLDGTKETFENAKNNFKFICKKLLIKGWCKDEDFVNFEWY